MDQPIIKFEDKYFMNVGKNDNYQSFLNEKQVLILKDSFGEYIKKYDLWLIHLKHS